MEFFCYGPRFSELDAVTFTQVHVKSTHLLGVEKILDRPSCYLIWPSELT